MDTIDYTKFRTDGKVSKPKDEINKRWWLGEADTRAKNVFGVVRQLAQYDVVRNDQYALSAKLYDNTRLRANLPLQAPTLNNNRPVAKSRLGYNLVKSVIDTVVAKLSKNKPKPLFLTEGGSWKLMRRAHKLNEFVDGIFYENKAYKLGRTITRDAMAFGDAFVHVFEHYGRVKFERVMAHELYVDWLEAIYGEPRQLHRVKTVDREVLKDLFPEKAEIIEKANPAPSQFTTQAPIADQILVVESWHLPSGPLAKDGCHTINVDSGNLLDEPYKKDHFPFARYGWGEPIQGYWSQSLAEQLEGKQLELNKMLWVASRSFHLAGSFKILLKAGSKIVKEHLNNDIGAIIEYVDTPPEYVTPPALPQGHAEHTQQVKQDGYEEAGVSQLSAASQKPAGLDSGKALREFNDIESDRFMTAGQAYEEFFLILADLAIDCAKDIYAREKKYSVRVPQKRFLKTIDWSDIDLERDDYVMKAFPISSLPNDPAGRSSTIQEYVQAGWIPPRMARRLMDFPDLDQIENLLNAPEEYLHKILEQICDEGVYTPPEPEDDLALAKQLFLLYYAQGKYNGLEEDRLDLLRQFNAQLDALTPQPPGPGGPGGMPIAPQAQAAQAPQSDLVPNAPGIAA